VVILGASGDSVKAQASFRDKGKLNFSLLSDPDFNVIEAYGARRMKKFLGKSFLGIVRSSFLIGPDRKIEYVWDNVRAKGHAAQVLGVTQTFVKNSAAKAVSAGSPGED
jgi:thioredoxin-dependent peroxiredoxin